MKCKCGSENFAIMIKGTQKGLYCADCGKWIKWLTKDEFNKYKIQGVKIITE